jgi:hypothetical protein
VPSTRPPSRARRQLRLACAVSHAVGVRVGISRLGTGRSRSR